MVELELDERLNVSAFSVKTQKAEDATANVCFKFFDFLADTYYFEKLVKRDISNYNSITIIYQMAVMWVYWYLNNSSNDDEM